MILGGKSGDEGILYAALFYGQAARFVIRSNDHQRLSVGPRESECGCDSLIEIEHFTYDVIRIIGVSTPVDL